MAGIIQGYPCGGVGEPCGPGTLPYFRPNNDVLRGQTAKIVQLARSQPLPTGTPTRTTSPTSTSTSTPVATGTPIPTDTSDGY